MRYLVLVLLFVSNVTYGTFLPENNLDQEDNYLTANMSEYEFNNLIYEFYSTYQSIYENLGYRLSVKGNWSDSTVNAYTYMEGNTVYIEIFGGLARRPELSLDGFSSVLCHEAGHTLAGFPFYQGEGMAAEGQADYYTTQVCHKRIWQYSNNQGYASFLDAEAKVNCNSTSDKELCYRSQAAGLSLAKLLSNGGRVSYSTPDRTVVRSTQTSHPNAQCRLDTYGAGSLCGVQWNDNVVPLSEEESYWYLCKSGQAARPRCWFAPRM